MDNERTEEIVQELIETIRRLEDAGYDRNFADMLHAETGITDEELLHFHVFNTEMLGRTT